MHHPHDFGPEDPFHHPLSADRFREAIYNDPSNVSINPFAAYLLSFEDPDLPVRNMLDHPQGDPADSQTHPIYSPASFHDKGTVSDPSPPDVVFPTIHLPSPQSSDSPARPLSLTDVLQAELDRHRLATEPEDLALSSAHASLDLSTRKRNVLALKRRLHSLSAAPTKENYQHRRVASVVLEQCEESLGPVFADREELVAALEVALRGMRLAKQFDSFGWPTDDQELLDFLSTRRLLTPESLRLFSGSKDVRRLDLTLSLADPAGLSPFSHSAAAQMLEVFSRSPRSFPHLASLRLSGVDTLRSEDLSHLRGLRLAELELSHCDLMDLEACCHLVALKRSLASLSLAGCSLVDDKCLCVLGLLEELQALELEGTAVSVDGFRGFVETCLGRAQMVRVKLPRACRYYFESSAKSRARLARAKREALLTNPSHVACASHQTVRRNLDLRGLSSPQNQEEGRERLRKVLMRDQMDAVCEEYVLF